VVARPFRSEGLVLGLLLVAVGSLWMAANLGKLDLLATLRTWWPASLVIWGAIELLAVALERAGGGPSKSRPDEASYDEGRGGK
jgi:hypothetical protein